MNTNSNVYTIVYASVMVIIVAFVLAFFSGSLKERQDLNVKLDKKKQILYSLNLDLQDKDPAALYQQYITQELIVNVNGDVVERKGGFDLDIKTELAKKDESSRLLPVYECNIDGETKYIFPLYGAGLWGPIWGYIALNHHMFFGNSRNSGKWDDSNSQSGFNKIKSGSYIIINTTKMRGDLSGFKLRF